MNKERNYIVSGIERSGTSMMMQMLEAGGVPVMYDHKSRPADTNNPKGYYELEGGKIINLLGHNKFPFDKYKGAFIKITSYGILFLPKGKYTVIYMERNINEVLDSMDRMRGASDTTRGVTKKSFNKLNLKAKNELESRANVRYLKVNYNKVINNPKRSINSIKQFIDIDIDRDAMINVIDKKLYRNRR